MRLLIACVVLTCLYWNCASLQCQSAQDESKQQTTNPLRQEHELSVSAEIVNQSYCHVYDESFTVQMDVKLRFTNVSDHPVILAKRIESPPVVRAARTVQDAEKGNFEYAPNVDYFPTELPASPRFGEKPDAQNFVTLTPHQSYEARVFSGVFGAVTTAKARKGSGLLAKGNHVLQLGVGTWPYQWPYFTSSADVNPLSDRWSRYGHLAHGFVYSNFVSFTIPDKFENPPCKPTTP